MLRVMLQAVNSLKLFISANSFWNAGSFANSCIALPYTDQCEAFPLGTMFRNQTLTGGLFAPRVRGASERPLIEKTRYREASAGRTWELDVFHGETIGVF